MPGPGRRLLTSAGSIMVLLATHSQMVPIRGQLGWAEVTVHWLSKGFLQPLGAAVLMHLGT